MAEFITTLVWLPVVISLPMTLLYIMTDACLWAYGQVPLKAYVTGLFVGVGTATLILLW